MIQEFFSIEVNGKLIAEQCLTRDRAIEAGDEWWASYVQDTTDEPLRNGQEIEADCTIVKYRMDDDGDVEEVEREETTLTYEHYHGDLAEHGTYY